MSNIFYLELLKKREVILNLGSAEIKTYNNQNKNDHKLLLKENETQNEQKLNKPS